MIPPRCTRLRGEAPASWGKALQAARNILPYVLLVHPAALPADLFDAVPKHQRTPLSEITELADRTRLVYDEGLLGLLYFTT